MSKKVMAKQEGGQREGKRKEAERKKEDPHSSAWLCISRKQAGDPLSVSSSLGNATEQSPAQFTRQKAQSGHTQPSFPFQSF